VYSYSQYKHNIFYKSIYTSADLITITETRHLLTSPLPPNASIACSATALAFRYLRTSYFYQKRPFS
jgi:hypothetical protein